MLLNGFQYSHEIECRLLTVQNLQYVKRRGRGFVIWTVAKTAKTAPKIVTWEIGIGSKEVNRPGILAK